MAYEGELPDMHDPSIASCVVRITPMGEKINPGIRDVVGYFTTAELAQTAADAMKAAGAAEDIPDTRYEVCDPRRTFFPQ